VSGSKWGRAYDWRLVDVQAGMNIFSDAEKQVSVFPETRKSGRQHGDAQVRHGLYGNII
jgi:hypothetical protein